MHLSTPDASSGRHEESVAAMSCRNPVYCNLLGVRNVYWIQCAGLRRNPFVSRTIEEHSQRLRTREQPEHSRILNVAIIGTPNSGKSTLMNRIIGMSVSAASPKAHTTRKNIIGVYTEDSAQLIFHDSPGLVTAAHCMKHKLEANFRTDPKASANVSDVMLAIVDCSNPRESHKLNPGVIDILKSFRNKPSVLLLNKVDILGKKHKILDITNRLTNGIVGGVPVWAESDTSMVNGEKNDGEVLDRMICKGYIYDVTLPEEEKKDVPVGWGEFSRVFMISALTGDGVKELVEYLVSQARPGNWQFDCDVPSPRNPLAIAGDIIREQIFIHLRREAPYLITPVIQVWSHDARTGAIAIYVELIAPNDNYTSALLGSQGSTISKISVAARQELCNTFQCDVMLKIAVKCKNGKVKK